MINHPIPKGTKVIAEYTSCETCGPSQITKVGTRITNIEEIDGRWLYTLLDGRKVDQSSIIEVH